MKSNKRKGFTVVELVIVIAIIAVLAAVLIPTFAGLVRRANISKDTQLVRNLNTALAAAVEKPKTMHEALGIAEDAGYRVDKINASATSNEILYDSKNNVFCYYNATNPSEGSVEYIPESAQGSQITDPAEYYLLWKIYDSVPAEADQKFSIYLADNANVSANATITVSVGFDAGTNENIKQVDYKSDKEQTVVIRTNSLSTVLKVDAEKSNVTHYGDVEKVDVVRVAMASYHEAGRVAGNINVAYGKVVVEATASVNSVVVMALDGVAPATESIAVEIKDSAKSGTQVVDTTDKLTDVAGAEKQKATVVTTLRKLSETAPNGLIEAAAEGGYIILGADITPDYVESLGCKSISLNQNITLNFAGHTIYGQVVAAGSKDKTLTLEGNGTIDLKVKQEKPVDKTKILKTQAAVSARYGTIIINGINIISDQLGISSDTAYLNNCKIIVNEANVIAQEHAVFGGSKGNIEINGGTFKSLDNAVVATHGESVSACKITINGGTFNGEIKTTNYVACGIYLANKDELVVNGGTFNIYNGCGILMRAGKATIGKDVKINLINDGTVASGKVGDSPITVSAAAAIVKDSRSEYSEKKPEIVKNESEYTVQEIN